MLSVKDVYCYEGSGEGYKGYESKAASGASCTGRTLGQSQL